MKDTRPTLPSLAIASPTSAPPQHTEATAPGIPFFSSTLDMIFVVAIVIKLVLVAPFHNTLFPHTNAIAAFQP